MDRLISEQAVIDSIEFFQMNPQHFDFVNLIDDIKEIPSAEPKTGHWEWIQYDSNPNIGNWHCSECRNIVSDMPTCMGKPLYEFCPNCGCPMEIER